jgi:Tol biopolymer transport system component/predicted Ser/Thr protein kinase
MPISAGDRLGPYEILARIGAGGMGEVWKARDTRLDRLVAVKVSKAQFTERFEREAHAVAALNHPHICTLHDVGPNYLVMEFVEGSTLHGPLPLPKALEYAAQICDALDAAHRKGITHRDLKPANILVNKQGVKLLDFGLAHMTPGPNDPTLTQAGAVMGTPAYMAPEQSEGKPADARSDIYAFGCVLYEMLTGKRVSQDRVVVAPPALERIVKTCLATDPDERFQNALDLKRNLTWAAEPSPSSNPSPPAKPVSRTWMWTAAAILVLGLLAAWGVSRFRPSAAQDVVRLQIAPPEGAAFVTNGGVALSPDGKTAVFVATADGKRELWIRPLDSTAARLLPGTEGANRPFWSPDGKTIAFFANRKLQRIDLAGGAPFTICDAVSAVGGAWTSDGRIILGLLGKNLFQVAASGGTPSSLTTLDTSQGDVAHAWPQVLPGGHFLYWTPSSKPENNGTTYEASFAKPNERVPLVQSKTNALYVTGTDGQGYLLWRRGETLVAQTFDPAALKLSGEPHPLADSVATAGASGWMVVAVSSTGLLYGAPQLSHLTWFDRIGKMLNTVGDPGQFNVPRFSPNGRLIAVTRQESDRDLWLIEVDQGMGHRLTSDSGGGFFPLWSPDGRTLLVLGENLSKLVRRDAAGTSAGENLAPTTPRDHLDDWSRDGGSVLLSREAPDTKYDLWIYHTTPDGKLTPGNQPTPYLRTAFNEQNARFSPEPNPRWVAYQSDATGRFEIYLQSFPQPRGEQRLSTGGGTQPRWSADGRELFYVSPDNQLMAVSLKLGADSVQASTPRVLFPLRGGGNYEPAPDGQRFLSDVPDPPRPLTMIVNWTALLKK